MDDLYTQPPEAFAGQVLSASWLNAYYGRNIGILYDLARATTSPWRVIHYTGPAPEGAPDDDDKFTARLRRRFNHLYYRVTIHFSDLAHRKPSCLLKAGATTLIDLGDAMASSPPTQTLIGTLDISATPGLVVGEAYTLTLDCSGNDATWPADSTIELETWYEIDTSAAAYTPVSEFIEGQILDHEQVNAVRADVIALEAFARRVNWSLPDVEEGWNKTGDFTRAWDLWNETHYRMVKRLPLLHFHVTWVYWHGDPIHYCEILINNAVVVNVRDLVPISGQLGEITREIDGQIDLDALGITGNVSVVFRHKPYDGERVYGGHVALTQLYQCDPDADPTPAGWTNPNVYAHLDYPTAAHWNVYANDLEAIHTLASARVNHAAAKQRHWVKVGNDNAPNGNGLVLMHRSSYLYYQAATYDADSGPAIYPLGDTEQSVSLPTDDDATKVLVYDLSQVSWLKSGGMLYRVTGAAYAWEDEAWSS